MNTLIRGSDIDINNEVEIQKNQINWDWNIIFNEIPTPNPGAKATLS